MQVDEGALIGGFERAYDAAIVEEADTPVLRAIAASTGLHRVNSVTVEVVLSDGAAWSRSFSASFSEELPDCLFTTPNPYVLGVRVRGTVFFVDVTRPDDAVQFEALPVSCSASDVEGGRLFFASDTEVYAFDGVRLLWTSRRLSLDGIRDLSYADGQVHGIGTDVGVEAAPFTVDASTGEVAGGFEGFERWRIVED
jgi:hypothetical protein